MASSSLESIKYDKGGVSLAVIDQLKLPTELAYVPVSTAEAAWTVIRTMQVRGAPLIAIVAALGLAVHVNAEKDTFKQVAQLKSFLLEKIDYLRTSRPTAVNLFVATDELKALVLKVADTPGTTVKSLVSAYIQAAEEIWIKDVATNKNIGDIGEGGEVHARREIHLRETVEWQQYTKSNDLTLFFHYSGLCVFAIAFAVVLYARYRDGPSYSSLELFEASFEEQEKTHARTFLRRMQTLDEDHETNDETNSRNQYVQKAIMRLREESSVKIKWKLKCS